MDYRKKALKYQKRYNELLQMRGGAGRPFGYNEFKPGAPGHSTVKKEITAEDLSNIDDYFDDLDKKEKELESAIKAEEEMNSLMDAFERQSQERRGAPPPVRESPSSSFTATPSIPESFSLPAIIGREFIRFWSEFV